MAAVQPGLDSQSIVSPGDNGALGQLKDFLAGHQGDAVMVATDGTTAELPVAVLDVMAKAVEALADGQAVAVTPVSARLTTTQAAEVLGVSRPTLVKMLEDGKIPFEQLNVHRTVELSDLLAYKQRRRAKTRAILDQMTRQAVADGLYSDSYQDYAEALHDENHPGR